MKRNLLLIAIVLLICGLFVFFYSENKRDHGNNGFRRDIKDLGLTMGEVLPLPSTKVHLAGISKTRIYLQDLNYPQFGLFYTDYALSGLNEINLNLPKDFSVKHQKINIRVPNDTMAAVLGIQTGDLRCINLNNGRHQIYKSPGIYFDRTVYVAPGLMAGRYVEVHKKELKINLVRVNYEKSKIDRTYSLKREPEEVFSNDGRLEWDAEGSRLFYTYYYRGEFLCLDTNMALLYKGKTIDTTTAQISIQRKVGAGPGNKGVKITQNKPPETVNRYSCIYQNRFYLCSSKIADNEDLKVFNANNVVDVYAAGDGKYEYSFYIPKFKGEKMRDFSVRNDGIVALYKSQMVKYRLARNPS